MATKTWTTGGTSAAALGLQSGDTLNEDGGTVVGTGNALAGVTVNLAGTGSASAALLLADATIGNIQLYPDTTRPTGQYGNIDVYGTVTDAGGISMGGSIQPPGFAYVTLHGPTSHLTLNGTSSVQQGSTLTVAGDPGSVLENNGSIGAGGRSGPFIHIETALTGNGTIAVARTPENVGSIELDGSVGRDQKIDLMGGSLLLTNPMTFLGEVNSFGGSDTLNIRGNVIFTQFNQTGLADGYLSVLTSNPNAPSGFDLDQIHMGGTFAANAFSVHQQGTTAIISLAADRPLG